VSEPPPDRLALLAHAAVRTAVGRELGQVVEYHERIGSTQDRARELAPGPALVVADLQTAGRGTKDRSWVAGAGSSLLVSFVLPGPPAAAAVASLVAGVAVARALDALGTTGALVKWPNDVLLRGRKIAGILTQSASGPGGHVVVGIGLNVSQTEGDLTGLRAPATSLALEGRGMDRLVALEALARAVAAAFAAAPEAVLGEWRQRSNVLGRRVLVSRDGGSPLRGRAEALDPDGALRVETAYGPERILVGEVTVDE
jgi:BirA family biotin operon repressor/biotin-[acetyl-CoA-carboxylase] ligase